ncbi:retrotransposon protein, putative, ty1-copia subclass [Tanacetum coccineum]|uniref:Retrotransposon protein, putative, ty1-copia subclass n=1 Tax=Tanacetum coccineum TaxID=301880 RepID=A0ABQ4ZVH1_9ASTR
MNLTTLPLSFWYYDLETATRILNMVPTKKVDKIPYELWYGKVPNLSYLKEIMGYYFYFPPENKIVVARYVEFLEKKLLSQEINVEGFEPPQEEVVPVRRSARTHQAPGRLCLNVEVEEHSLVDLNEPTNYKAAMLDLKSDKGLDAINAGMQSMKANQVWCLVDLSPNCKIVRRKWLFKKKTDMDGIVYTYKARLVGKGFTQTYEVDYEETFSPVADIRAIRILIAIAAFYDYEIWQMDVRTAFLNGYLEEDIYMVQPKGFIDPKHPKKVCKFQKSIYGLKQASRSWNKRFDEEIKRFGFAQNLDEPSVYQKASGSNVTFLILYVDDIIIMGNHILSLQSVKSYIGKCFTMKDLGEAAFILGIKIYRDRSKRLIRLSQSAYMDKILKKIRMDTSKHGYIPMQEKLDLNKTQGASTPEEVKRMQNVPNASASGVLTRRMPKTSNEQGFISAVYKGKTHEDLYTFDLPYGMRAIGTKWVYKNKKDKRGIMIRNKARLVARGYTQEEVKINDRIEFTQVTPKVSHLHAVKRIFRYLKGQPKLGLWYPKDSPFDLEAYSDSDYAGASLDRKSTTGAEYVATASCCGQVLWIQNQMLDYGYNFMNTKIFIDNESTICIVKNPVFHLKTKHIKIRHHFIRDSNEKKLIQMIKIHTDQNVTDLLTKAFDVGRIQYLIASIGMLNL